MPIVPPSAVEPCEHGDENTARNLSPILALQHACWRDDELLRPVLVHDHDARRRLLVQVPRSILASRDGAPMLAHAEEAFVQHVQQLDDTRLLADVDEADVALLSSAPVYVFVYIAGRIRGAVLVVLSWYRLEGGKLDNTHENCGRARHQMHPAFYRLHRRFTSTVRLYCAVDRRSFRPQRTRL